MSAFSKCQSPDRCGRIVKHLRDPADLCDFVGPDGSGRPTRRGARGGDYYHYQPGFFEPSSLSLARSLDQLIAAQQQQVVVRLLSLAISNCRRHRARASERASVQLYTDASSFARFLPRFFSPIRGRYFIHPSLGLSVSLALIAALPSPN